MARETDKDDLVFKALANADRRKILDLIKEQARTTGNISEQLGHINRCTVMLHLGTLEKAELIITQKRGRERWNYLNVAPIQQVYSRWIKEYAQPAAGLLTKIKFQVEQP